MELLLALPLVLRGGHRAPAAGGQAGDEDQALSAGFLVQLAKRPRWLLGIAADFLGFLCQAAALTLGRLVVVQPILASSILFALPFGARLTGEPVGRRRWAAAGVVTLGLAVFLLVGDPSGGVEDASTRAWIISGVVALVLTGALVGLARGRRPAPRAALLGAAAGAVVGISAGLTKATVEQLDDGVLAILEHWHLYALTSSALSMTLEAALQTGELARAGHPDDHRPDRQRAHGHLRLPGVRPRSTLGAAVSFAALALMMGGIAVGAGGGR